MKNSQRREVGEEEEGEQLYQYQLAQKQIKEREMFPQEKQKIATKGKIIWGLGVITVILFTIAFLSFHKCQIFQSSFQISQLKEKQMLASNYEFESQKRRDKQLFAYSLFRQPQNQNLLEIEKKRFNSLYEIDEVEEQLPLCVTIVGYNTVQNYRNMLSSVFRQNYTNFHVVHIDDASSQEVQLKLRKYVENLSLVKPQNIKLFFNYLSEYGLLNRDKIIRHHCNPGEIIINLDSEDALIGKQVFRLVNSFYQKDHDLWLFSTDNLVKRKVFYHGDLVEATKSNISRTSGNKMNHYLTTYRRQLYMKIYKKDLLNREKSYFLCEADELIFYSLSEMSGKNHQKKIIEYAYFDHEISPKESSRQLKICQFAFKMQTPYKPLQDLSQKAQIIPNYILSHQIVNQFTQFMRNNHRNTKINLRNYRKALKFYQSDQTDAKLNYEQEIDQRQIPAENNRLHGQGESKQGENSEGFMQNEKKSLNQMKF